MPVQGSDWHHVQVLPTNTKVRITSDTKTVECAIDSVDDQQLTCSRSHMAGAAHYVFPRAEVKKIKLSAKGRSTAGGAAIGIAVGAGAGAGIGAAVNSGTSGSYLHVSGGKSAAVGAALGGIILGGVGAAVGHSTDLFAGPVVYSR